jgi:hypothetical protein
MRSNFASHRQGGIKLVVLVVILLIGLGVAIWIWTRPANQAKVDEGRSVAETFLGELQQGRPEAAWQSTTAEFKSDEGKESFVAAVKPVKFLKEPLEFVSVQTVQVGEMPRSEYLYRAKTGETVRIVLAREEGQWKVDRWLR